MAEESYIQFYYNYDTHERAKQSSLLLFHLLEEKVGFTSIPDNGQLPPEILIKTSERETPSRYQSSYFNDQEIVKNFKEKCRIIRESALEKETVSARV